MALHSPDLRTRSSRVAQDYMRRKGYEKMRPVHCDRVDGQPVWYYYYDLPEALLELEIELSSADFGYAKPTAFRVGEHLEILKRHPVH